MHRTRHARTLAAVLCALTLIGAAAAFGLLPILGGRGSHPAYAGGRWDGTPFGGTWTLTSLTRQTNALLHDPQHPATVWAGTSQGIAQSSDAGTHWQPAGLPGQNVLALAASSRGATLVAGTDAGAIYLLGSRRGGPPSWRLINHPLGDTRSIFSLALSPDDRTILAGTTGAIYRGNRGVQGWTWQRVARTADSGVTSIVWAPWNRHLVYAAVFSTAPVVIVSGDGGLHWVPDTRGLPASVPSQTLVPLPSRPPSILFTTMGGGVWMQTINHPWHDISTGLPARHGMPVAVTWSGGTPVLYTGTMGWGVYGKEGSGPWQPLGTGLEHADHTVLSLIAVPNGHPTLLAGTALGVFRYAPPGQ